MQQILNSVYLFTKIQVTQQYREAVEESKRIDNIQKTLALGHIVADEDR